MILNEGRTMKLLLPLIFTLILSSCVEEVVESANVAAKKPQNNEQANTGRKVFISSPNGLNITTDLGNTFTNINTNVLTNMNVNFVTQYNNRMMLSTNNDVSISDDQGATWRNITNGDGIANLPYGVIEYSAFDGNVYLGTPGNGMFYSTNNGDNFVPILNEPSNNITAMEVDTDGGTFYLGTDIGFFYCPDPVGGMATATFIDFTDAMMNNVSAAAGANATSNSINRIDYNDLGDMDVFVSTDKGLFRIQYETMVTHAYLMIQKSHGIVIDNNGTWFVATSSGVAISTNQGATFEFKQFADGLPASSTTGISIDEDDNIYVTTLSGYAVSYNGGNSFISFTDNDGLLNHKSNNILIIE